MIEPHYTELPESAIRSAIEADPKLAAALEPVALDDGRYVIVLSPELHDTIRIANEINRTIPAGEETSHDRERLAKHIAALKRTTSLISKSPALQVGGSISQWLTRMQCMLEDGHDLIADARKSWNERDF